MNIDPKTQPGSVQRIVSRQREDRALEALCALALHQDYGPLTASEIANYLKQPPKLSKEDEAALRRAHPEFLKALRERLRPDAKRLVCGDDQAC